MMIPRITIATTDAGSLTLLWQLGLSFQTPSQALGDVAKKMGEDQNMKLNEAKLIYVIFLLQLSRPILK